MNNYPLLNTARYKAGRSTGFQNGGWCYDNYPELKPLDAGAAVEIAAFEGPGVITCLHVTQHLLHREAVERHFQEDGTADGAAGDGEHLERDLQAVMRETKEKSARGVVLEIYYNGRPEPAVCCTLSDFFADGCNGSAVHFSTPFLEKLPESYNCYIPLPFEKSIRIVLHNETEMDLMSYSFVEYEKLPGWEDDLLYFHAARKQDDFRLGPDTEREMITISGKGHYVGNHYSVVTTEPVFKDFFFVMEGNVEHRLDGEEDPSIDYLGTEDSFCLSWGFRDTFCGLHSGINYLKTKTLPYMLSIYRFRYSNPVLFEKSLDIKINWKHEFTMGRRNYHSPPRERVRKAFESGGCNIQYTSTHYWYQELI